MYIAREARGSGARASSKTTPDALPDSAGKTTNETVRARKNCSKRELNASAFRRGANSPLWQAERKAKGGAQDLPAKRKTPVSVNGMLRKHASRS